MSGPQLIAELQTAASDVGVVVNLLHLGQDGWQAVPRRVLLDDLDGRGSQSNARIEVLGEVVGTRDRAPENTLGVHAISVVAADNEFERDFTRFLDDSEDVSCATRSSHKRRCT
jgi:hypothetical protein